MQAAEEPPGMASPRGLFHSGDFSDEESDGLSDDDEEVDVTSKPLMSGADFQKSMVRAAALFFLLLGLIAGGNESNQTMHEYRLKTKVAGHRISQRAGNSLSMLTDNPLTNAVSRTVVNKKSQSQQKHVLYLVDVTLMGETETVQRRFGQFVHLHADVR